MKTTLAVLVFLCSNLVLAQKDWEVMSSVKSAPGVENFVGKSGILLAKPTGQFQFLGEGSPFKNIKELKRCEPVTVDDIVENPKLYKQFVREDIIWYLSQGENKFAVVIPKLEQKYSLKGMKYEWFFSNKLSFKDRKTKIKDSGKKSTKDLLCNEVVFTTMTEDELVFVKGHPEKVNKTVSHGSGKREQWVYPTYGGSSFDRAYYYFQNGKLMSWQE